MLPQTGDIVRVRSRQYLVEEVVLPPSPGDSSLVSLSCLDDDAQGEPLTVLWEREVDARSLEKPDWEAIASRGFDEPRLFSSYLNTLRWNCVTATDAKLFQSPFRAGIQVKSYQLEPLRKALEMPRVNMFIADDVGLGKTIEAGLILREMLMRQKVRRCVICVPPSVVRQWHDEMEQRFGLTFMIYDREFVAARRQERGFAVNPWTTHNRFIISHALIRNETYAGPLRDWLGEFSGGAMLILDEAHNAAPASGSKYAIDSKLTRTMRDICPRFEHKLFLSATPHNGHSNSFSALLELLDPQRFCRGVPVKPALRDQVMVRRLKADLRKLKEEFPERRNLRVALDDLDEDAPELVLSRLLQEYRQMREERLRSTTRAKRASAMLVITSLQKRLLSSIEAFARTLAVHQRALERQAEAASEVSETSLPLLANAIGPDDERGDLPEEDVASEEDSQMSRATAATIGTAEEMLAEVAIVRKMADIANVARHEPDVRVKYLLDWLQKKMCPELGKAGAAWNSRRVLIFTEYTDTKGYLQVQLSRALAGTDRAADRVLTFHGGIGDERREEIKAAFNSHPDEHPLRILIATDAAREGVNLQNHCADLFHFDVPWNPSRMEQRNGRLDRKLQRAPVVNCHYFVLPQRPEDRVLDKLVDKTEQIIRELGSLIPVVEGKVDKLLRRGIEHRKVSSLLDSLDQVDRDDNVVDVEEHSDMTATISVVGAELEGARDRDEKLAGQLGQLDRLLEKSKLWIGLDNRHFRDAISASLELMGAGTLTPVDKDKAARDPENTPWEIPRLHERLGADPTWATSLDSLREPIKPGQKLWQWRKEAPIRPVIFSDPGTLDHASVHVHLEHRLVRRLLGRFVAQGFLYNDIRRGCVVRTRDAIPRVVVLGRLSLFGSGASRLHDEVIAAAAEWLEPEHRGRRKLRPLTEGDKEDVLTLLYNSLAQESLHQVPSGVVADLRASAPQDVEELHPHLVKRADVLIARAERDLQARGEREAKQMRSILESLRDRIVSQRAEDKVRQPDLFMTAEEKRQLDANRKHWAARLDSLAQELVAEPERVKRTYEVKTSRVEPVGIIYLWPVSR